MKSKFELKLKKKMGEVKQHWRETGDTDYSKGALDGLKYAAKQSKKFKVK